MKKTFCILLTLLFACNVFSAGADGSADVIITEESGGEFRPLPINLEGGAPLKEVTYSSEISVYQDPTIRVERGRVESAEWTCTYYYAFITIRDASQLRTASADEFNPFRSSAKTVANGIARRKNAVLAVNGDYCAAFSGNKSTNYVLRQGTVYQESAEPGLDMLLIDEDGDFHVLTADQDLQNIDKTQIDGKKVINAFQFGPALVIDGEKVPDEIIMDSSRNPAYAKPGAGEIRMCIAQIDTLHYMVLTCAHWGMELNRFRDLAMSLADCKTVYTLDGGLSAQLVFLGRKINNIQDHDSNRPVTDIIYFASAWYQ